MLILSYMYGIIIIDKRRVIDMKNNELGLVGLVEPELYINKHTSALQEMKMEVSQAGVTDLYTNTLSENTKRAYMSTIKEFFGVNDLSDITVQELQEVTPEIANVWAKKQFNSGMMPSTINRKLSALQNFYKFLCRRNVGVVAYNPFDTNEGCVRFKNAQKDYTEKRALTPQEIHKLLSSINVNKAKNKTIALRDLIILQILCTAGLRRAELCDIKIGDIKYNQGEYVIEVLGKGGKKRFMVIAPQIKENIDEYIKLRGLTYSDAQMPLIVSHSTNADPTQHVNTITVYRVVKKYADKAGINADDIAPHNLRHSFATIAYNELDMKPEEIQKLMGHSSASTTKIYLHTADMIKNSPSSKLAAMFDM